MQASASDTVKKQNGEAMHAEKMDSVTPGQRQEQRVAEAPHQPHPPASAAPVAATKGSNTSGAILENAAASVSSALQSAREVISKH
ncbi:hypothetical protein Hanom_Chr15g01374541 [Helianthus anomalus]